MPQPSSFSIVSRPLRSSRQERQENHFISLDYFAVFAALRDNIFFKIDNSETKL
jgi:hypothetical protein